MDTRKLLSFIAILTVLLFVPIAFGAALLSSSEILLTLKSYDCFAELMNSKMNSKADDDSAKPRDNESFTTFFYKFTTESNEAEEQACLENGINRDNYQLIFNRIYMVKMYYFYKEVQDKLKDDLRQRETMTDDDLDREAEKRYREMEQLYDRVGGNVTFEDVKKKRDEKLKQYLDTISKQNFEIEKYNRNLLPNRTIAKLQQKISHYRAKLSNPRYDQFQDKIEDDIAQLEEIMVKLAKRDGRRKKSKKKPDPLILKKINEPVETFHVRQENSFYTALIQDIRDKKGSGQWHQTIRNTNHKKILELHTSVKKLDKILTDSQLKQAALDADTINRVIDRERLMALSPLPWQQNIPGY